MVQSRCPVGTRKNRKTKVCEKKGEKKYERCPVGSRKNRKTKVCEKKKGQKIVESHNNNNVKRKESPTTLLLKTRQPSNEKSFTLSSLSHQSSSSNKSLPKISNKSVSNKSDKSVSSSSPTISAPKISNKSDKSVSSSSNKTSVSSSEEEEVEVDVEDFEIEGHVYLKGHDNMIYDYETQERVGKWDPITQTMQKWKGIF